MAKPVVIKILGDAASLTRSVEISQTALSRLGGAARAAAIGVGIAGASITAAVVKQAVSFEEDMASVFTLLPGITGEAMNTMSGQVLDFSKDLGIVPGEVVPALYDALSAGVPQDNVFEFMETAGKAAIGGNLEVADAVDLLSTAVNAYAATGLEAAEASDLFFTTVRLGKTTVPELQSAFSQVGPVAAALGVALDEVGASMAVLTASGVPTAQAATQVRSAIAELGKTGTVAARAFEELNGESFNEFIDNGGTFEEAIISMAESGEPLIDMFGSIEAAQAVMSLTANGGRALASALDAMGDSAGSTDAAFETMDATVARNMDRIKANILAVGIEMGDKLLPAIAAVTDYLVQNMPRWIELIEPVVKNIIGGFSAFGDTLKGVDEGLNNSGFAEFMIDLATVVRDDLWPVIKGVKDWLVEHWPEISAVLTTVKDIIVNDVFPAMGIAFTALKDAGKVVVDWIVEHWPEIEHVLLTVKDVIVDDILPALQVALEAFLAVVESTVAWITENWPEISAVMTTVKNAVVDHIIPQMEESLQSYIDKAEGVVKWTVKNWPTISLVMGVVKDEINDHIISPMKDGMQSWFDKAQEIVTWFVQNWDGISTAFGIVKDFIVDDAVPAIITALEFLKDIAMSVLDTITERIDAVVSGVELIGGALGAVGGFVTGNRNEMLAEAAAAAEEQRLLDAVVAARDGQPRAHGGPLADTMIVGERGPELIRLPNNIGGGSVVANQDMVGSANGGINIYVNNPNATAQEIGQEVLWNLKVAG